MKELADYYVTVEDKIKRRKYRDLEILSQMLDSNQRVSFQNDIHYLEKIDTITSKNKFYDLLGDSLSKKYVFTDFKYNGHEPPEVRALYRNDQVLTTIDSMMSKTFHRRQSQYELVITEINLRDNFMSFEAEYFEVIQRDTPFVNPSTGEKWDTTDIEFYEAKVLEY